MMSVKKEANRVATANTPQKVSVVHRMAALLHTMRCITQHEDHLCELLNAAKGAPGLSRDLAADVEELLHQIPAQEYTHDIEALRDSLALESAPASPKKRSRPR